MKVCVFGAGAVGGHIAVKLLAARAADVSVVARGAWLDAIVSRGITLRSGGTEISAKPEVATDDPSRLPQQDLVIVTLKTPGVPAAAASIARLLAPRGSALFLLNGIPWWWRHGLAGAHGPLPLVDPGGALWEKLGPQRALGGVIYSPNDPEAPGIINHIGAERFVIGEPDNSSSERLAAAVDLFKRAGLNGESSADLRREIWRKLVSNASGNPLTALTRLNMSELAVDPDLSALMAAVMSEVLGVAAVLGWDLRGEVDVEGLSTHVRLPDVRTSMQQDVATGRPLEVEAQLGQVQAFAREAGVPVPLIDVLLPLLRGLDRSARAR